MFWEFRDRLLSLDRDELEQGVEDIIKEDALRSGVDHLRLSDPIIETAAEGLGPSMLTGIPRAESRLAVDLGPPVTSATPWRAPSSSPVTIWITEVTKSHTYPQTIYAMPASPARPQHLALALPSPKADSWAYKAALTRLVSAVKPLLDVEEVSMVLRPGTTAHLDLFASPSHVKEDSGDSLDRLSPPSDLVSSRKMILPLSLLLLCSFPALGGDEGSTGKLDKQAISGVLLSLVALWPDGNPPRAALKRVNEILLGSGRA